MKTIVNSLEKFLTSLLVTQGPLAGENLTILPWERRFLRGAMADDVSTAAATMGRGNGKTTFIGGIGAATIKGPLQEPRAETVIVASSLGQARIDFGHALAFLRTLPDFDEGDYYLSDNDQRAQLRHKRTGVTLKAIGSDPRRAHGLAPVLVIADEPAQWPRGTAGPMLAALETSLGKIDNSRMLAIGTQSSDPDHWFQQWLGGDCDFAMRFAAEEDDPPFQVKTWRKANPSLRHMPTLEAKIRAEAKRAKANPARLPRFKALRLNMGVADHERAMLIEADTLERMETDAPPRREGPCIWGVDLGTSAAMSAVAAYWPLTSLLCVLAAWPAVPTIAERARRDSVGDRYQRMLDRGDLIIAGDRTVDSGLLLDEALHRFGRPTAVCADRWREAELVEKLDQRGVPPGDFIPRGMGYQDGGEDVRRFRTASVGDRVKMAPSLLMRSALSEAVVMTDPAGNSKLAKDRQRARDDAAAAGILAVAEGDRRFQAGIKRRRLRTVAV